MTTILQQTYRPQIAPFLLGLIIDENNAETLTKVCNTAAGIPFGMAVSQDTVDKNCVIGGSKFIGLSQRDKTLALAAIDPLSLTDTPNPLDAYGRWANVSIMTRGRMAVRAGANVSAWDNLYYDSTTGLLTNTNTGASASGSITFSSQPAPNSTVTIQGTTLTFINTGVPTASQVMIGPTLGDTIVALAAVANASADANLVLMTYQAYPPSPGGSGQGSGSNTLLVGVKAAGVTGNGYTLATNVAGATVSGATLSGGTAGTNLVQITGGHWYTSAITGQLAVVTLGVTY